MKTLALLSLTWVAVTPRSGAESTGDSPTCEPNPSLCAGSVRRPAKASDAASSVPCDLYTAESVVHPGQWGVYSGIAVRKGEAVGQSEPVIPMVDAKMNEWSPWNALVEPSTPRLNLESKYLNSIFTPGIQQLVSCSKRYHNVLPVVQDEASTAAMLHRRQDAAAGSVALYEAVIVATHDLLAGEELVVPCDSLTRFVNPRGDDSDTDDTEPDFPQNGRRFVLSVEHLSDAESSNAVCLDQLSVGPSSVPGAGRGAFAKRDIGVGHVIMQTPVLHMDWSQMEIVKQSLYNDKVNETEDGESTKLYQPFLPIQREHGIKYCDQIIGQQLMLNYAYGSPESHVLLVPTGPTVNSINHNSDPTRVNAYLRWSHGHSSQSMIQLRPMELLSRASTIAYHDRSEGDENDSDTLMMEIVALRGIGEGEEVFLDYGIDWKRSWDAHVAKMEADGKSANGEEGPSSAAEWLATQKSKDSWRTEEEQVRLPYPANIQTACFVSTRSFEESQDALTTVSSMEWTHDDESNHMKCLRPCLISHRIEIDGQVTYNAIVFPMDRFEEPDECGGPSIRANKLLVEEIPRTAVTLIDKPYSTDSFKPGVFRHAIGAPQNFFPASWNHADPNPAGKSILLLRLNFDCCTS
jgi:hypothetical protein